jgi:hypothetical protein
MLVSIESCLKLIMGDLSLLRAGFECPRSFAGRGEPAPVGDIDCVGEAGRLTSGGESIPPCVTSPRRLDMITGGIPLCHGRVDTG